MFRVLDALPVTLGDSLGLERGRGRLGLCQSAVPVGARHSAPLPEISVILEAPQTSGSASQESKC